MAPAPSRFSRLLQQSRFASFDPNIHQVYTAPKAFMARGEWGMKRSMPSTPASPAAPHYGMLRYIEMSQLDSIDQQPTWNEREKEVLFLKRWSEANAKIHLTKPDTVYNVDSAQPGSHGPRPTTTFLPSTRRFTPSDIPGPIRLESAKTEAVGPEAISHNNKWRELMKYYAARGAADPSYKELDFKGAQTLSPAFGKNAEKYTTRPQMTVNYNTLSEKEFDKYIERIRSQRRIWSRFFAKKERGQLLAEARRRQDLEYAAAANARAKAARENEPLPPLPEFDPAVEPKIEEVQVDMLEQSRGTDSTRDIFSLLNQRMLDSAASPKNKDLPGKSQSSTIHPHAGLQYSQPDLIYTEVLAEPVPGRVIHEISSKNEREVRRFAKLSDGRSVLVGGRVGYLHAPLRSQAPPTIDWSRQNPKQGTALFRVTDAYRTTALNYGSGTHKDMLAPRNDLGYIRSNVDLIKTNPDGTSLRHPYSPGSPQYVGEDINYARPIRRPLGFSNSSSDTNTTFADSGNRRRRLESSRSHRLGRDRIDPLSINQDFQSNSAKQMFQNLENLTNFRN